MALVGRWIPGSGQQLQAEPQGLPSESGTKCIAAEHPTVQNGKLVWKVGCSPAHGSTADVMGMGHLKLACPCTKGPAQNGRPPMLRCECEAVPENPPAPESVADNPDPDNEWPTAAENARLTGAPVQASAIALALLAWVWAMPLPVEMDSRKAVPGGTAASAMYGRHQKLREFL